MKPVSSLHPVLYRVSVLLRRFHRRLKWSFGGDIYALSRISSRLPAKVVSHRSLLLRKLEGTDMELQRNKVNSLRIASSLIDSVVVPPGEVFSFWKLVGKPTVRRGFPPGLQLSFGSLVSMEGGGLCQMSNLLHWMVLQTPLTVIERHRHSTDPFPDYRRTVPFGTGATVFYNYLDFAFRNGTPFTFQVCVKTGSEYLEGEIRCDTDLPASISVVEKDHRFVTEGDSVFRMNELWRVETDVSSGRLIQENLLMKNRCLVLYDVPADMIDSIGED